MKKKFSKILGVGLTLALLCSLLLTAAPVSAVTTPVVTLTETTDNPAYEISKENIYTVLFTTGAKVTYTDEIVVVFEAGTNITDITTTDVAIESTAGLGGNFSNTPGLGFPAGTNPANAVVTGEYPAAQTLTITLSATATDVIGAGAIVQLTIGDTNYVTNPDTAGAYNLTVATQTAAGAAVIEAAVTSAAYTIIVPTIPGLPGVASVYNPVGVLMAQKNRLSQAITAAGDNYTIYVGPGTYSDALDIIDISHDGLTFVSTAGAATTIIDTTGKAGYAVTVSGVGVTFDGFTVTTDDVGAIKVTGADAIVQNNIITSTAGYPEGIRLGGSGATVSGNELSLYTTMMVIGATDCTLSDNTFGAGINLQGSTGITITENDLIGVEFTGIVFESSVSDDILIEGNTISETTGAEGTGIYFRPSIGTYDGIQIVGNDITDNEGDGIEITTGNILTDSVIKFNTITGNDTSTGDYGIQNTSDTPIDATLNWWGTTVASEVAAMVSGTATGTVTTEPFLAGTAEAVLSASDVAAGATSLDASTTVGVKVSGATDATVISVAKYIANPQEAIAGAIAFYDVYVAGTGTTDVTIKFYAGDALTAVYLWSTGTEIWSPVTPVTFSAYGGFVSVDVDPAMLGGTPFVLVAGAAAGLDTPPELLAPVTGDDTVSLTPIFAWEPVTDAEGYCFELADNANFVSPMVKLDGELGRLFVTAYAYVGELEYSTAYYWRVKATSGAFNPWIQWTQDAHFDVESDWATGVFITMDEPEEELPPVVVEEAPPVIIEPIVEVITPAATEITPSWIYVIIGVGGVLVIALLVLIVRTRRVA